MQTKKDANPLPIPEVHTTEQPKSGFSKQDILNMYKK